MLKLNKWPVRRRILVLPCLFSLGFALLLLTNVALENKMLQQVIFPNYDTQILNGHKQTLKALVDSEAITLGGRLSHLNTKEERIAAILSETDPIRFFDDNSGYFFTFQLDGVRVNVPINKADNGKNQLNLEDARGFRFVEALINKAKIFSGLQLVFS